MAKIQEIAVENIIRNEAIMSRVGGQADDAIKLLALSMQERHDRGVEPQEVAGIVRPAADKPGYFELIDGDGRLSAIELINESGGLDGETMTFRAEVVRSKSDEDSLVDSIQANFQSEPNVFARAGAMAKLQKLGKTTNQIAEIFGYGAKNNATVVQCLKLVDLPKKFRKAYEDGDLDQEACMAIADLDADDPKRVEIMENAIASRQRFQQLLAKVDHKIETKRAVDAITEAKERAEELKRAAKENEKARKELDKELSKADEKELPKVRQKMDLLKAEGKKIGKDWAQTEKEVLKLQDAKKKLVENPPKPAKSRATAEDVKEEAKKAGAKKKAKKSGPKEKEVTPRSKAQLMVELEALVESEKTSEAVKTLATHIQEFLTGDCDARALAITFKKCCKTDEEYK